MGNDDSAKKFAVEETPLLKPDNGISPGDEVVLRAEYNGETLKHRYRLSSWKLIGIDTDEIAFDEENTRGLIVTVGKYIISQQRTDNYLFVDDIVEEFDSSLVDEIIDSVTQDLDEVSQDHPLKSSQGGWFEDIDVSKL